VLWRGGILAQETRPVRRREKVAQFLWASLPPFFFGLFFRGGQNSSLQPHPSF
jgi:hypothetical protein